MLVKLIISSLNVDDLCPLLSDGHTPIGRKRFFNIRENDEDIKGYTIGG